jgi:hypothetical protein
MFMGSMLGPLAICLFMVFMDVVFFLYVDDSYGHGYNVLVYTCFLFCYVLVYGSVCSFVGLQMVCNL